MSQLQIPKGVDKSTRIALQKFAKRFRGDSTPTFASAKFTDLTASRLVASDSTDTLVSVSDLTSWIAGTADETTVVDDGDGTITVGISDPLIVGKGGTGAASLTDHSLLVGSGTAAITALGVGTNGQLPIGSTGADPVLATLTGTANQIAVTNGAGSIILSIPSPTYLGDGGTTNYLAISSTGDLTFNGSAGFYPVRLSQSDQPTPDTGELVVWHDTDDGKVYLVYNDTDSGVKQVEMT